MMSIPQNLCVPPGTTIRVTLEAITKNGRQVALVTDPDDRLLGIVTDGDVRKALLRGAHLEAPIGENMNATPLTRRAGLGRTEPGELMRARAIRHLPLVDGTGRLVDVVFLDDLLARLPLPASAVIMAGPHGDPAPAAHRGDTEAARGSAAGPSSRSSSSAPSAAG
jgi:predicted transcriptional regulator